MDKRQFTKCAVGLVCAAVLASASVQAGGSFGLSSLEPTIVHAQEQGARAKDSKGIVNEIRQGTRGPIYGGYFRTWHDKEATKNEEAAKDKDGHVQEAELNKNFGRPNSMADVPSDVDILFVFDNYVHEESPFWKILKEEYIPKMHAQGTAVVQTIGVKELSGKAGLSKDVYPEDTEESNKALAKAIVEKYVYDREVDGLDIDVELHDYNVRSDAKPEERAQVERANKVFVEIAKLIGKNGADNEKMLILDTTLRSDNHTILKENAKSLDLVLRQYYGPQGKNIVEDWKGYSQYISPRQFMIGFTFYEEGAPDNNQWFDVNQYDASNPQVSKSIEGTRAKDYANWQPDGGLKGGIFSYALERDGVGHPKKLQKNPDLDKIVKTDYSVSRALKAEMLKNKDYALINATDFPDPALLQAVKEQVSPYRGDLALYTKGLKLDGLGITNLTGLNKLSKLTSLEMTNLTDLKELKETDLPDSLRKTGDIKLTGMSGLEILQLPKSELQSLADLDVDSMTKLTKFDLSNNKFDFEGDKGGLATLLATVKKNNPLANNSDTVFEGQKPSGYLPESYETTEVTVPADGVPYDIFSQAVFGSVTKAGFFISGKEDFDVYKQKEIDGRKFVDQNWTYEEFRAKYDNHTVVSSTSTLREETNRSLNTSTDESYDVRIYNGDQEIHQMKVHVGQGKKFMENLSLGAKIVENTPGMRDVIKYVFDGDKSTTYRSFYEKGTILADLGSLGLVRHWRIINPETGIGGNLVEHRIKEATILVPKNPHITDVTKLKSEDWVEVANITNGKLIEENSVNVLARYWKLDIKKTYNGNSPYLSEFQILGWKVNGESYLSALEEVNNAKEAATVELSEETIKAFDEAVAEAKNGLEVKELTQAGIDAVATKLSELAKGLTAQVENKKIGYDIQANYRALMNKVKTLELDKSTFEKIKAIHNEMMPIDSQIDAKLGESVYDQTLVGLVVDMKIKMTEVAKLSSIELDKEFNVVPPKTAAESPAQ